VAPSFDHPEHAGRRSRQARRVVRSIGSDIRFLAREPSISRAAIALGPFADESMWRAVAVGQSAVGLHDDHREANRARHTPWWDHFPHPERIIAEIDRRSLYRMRGGRLPTSQQIRASAATTPTGKDALHFYAKSRCDLVFGAPRRLVRGVRCYEL
jgi:hypothetical protein